MTLKELYQDYNPEMRIIEEEMPDLFEIELEFDDAYSDSR